MNYKRYGMTLYDGTMLINRIYYGSVYTEEYAFIILRALLHEIIDILYRMKKSNNNLSLETSKFARSKKIFSDGIGNYFEKKLLPTVHKEKSLTLFEAEYLLKKENYESKTIKEFKKAFNTFRKENESEIKISRSFDIIKESNDNSFPIKIGCYCCGERKND